MPKSNKVFNGAIITVAMRWSDRLIGLVSTVVLARLLMPEDFGIVAMAMLVVGFVDVFLNMGVNQVLIHNREAEREDYDTAWTVRFVQSLCVGTIVFCTAPLAVDYFDTPDVANVLRVMAFSIVVGGLENIGIITFQKELEFGRDFKFFFIKRIISFIVTLTIAIVFQTYWAMVIGSVVGRLTGVILSYGMHSYRPSFSFARLASIWSFSQWVLFRNIGGYFDGTIDRFLIGNRLDATALGGYTLAGEVAALPTSELLAPIGRVLFPAFVDKRDDSVEFAGRVSMALGVQGMVALPACLGIAFVATDLVDVALGSKWLFIAPLIQIMAFSHLVVSLIHSCGYALLALGKVKIQAMLTWFQALLFVGIALSVGAGAEAEKYALIRFGVILVGSTALIIVTLFQLKIMTVSDFLSPLIRPVLATLLMVLMLTQLHSELSLVSAASRLFFEVFFGVIVYVVCMAVLWRLVGKPAGAEEYLLKNLRYR
jgi:polysaccharide transporter, PST family